jgi:hypothetical protein
MMSRLSGIMLIFRIAAALFVHPPRVTACSCCRCHELTSMIHRRKSTKYFPSSINEFATRFRGQLNRVRSAVQRPVSEYLGLDR